jgi:hypothetical protein
MGTKSPARHAPAAAGSTNTTQLADILRNQWKTTIKKLPPAGRWSWLGTQDAITALGAKTCANLRRQIERRSHEIRGGVCSAPWSDDYIAANVMPPGLKHVADDELHMIDDGRRFGVRLVRSAGLVRTGLDGVGTSRWTPEQAVKWEDEIDVMRFPQAYYFHYPPSVSGLQFQLIQRRKGREVEHRSRLKVKKKKGKVVDVVESEAITSADRIVELSQGGGVYRQGKPTVDTITMPGDRHVRAHAKHLPQGEP